MSDDLVPVRKLDFVKWCRDMAALAQGVANIFGDAELQQKGAEFFGTLNARIDSEANALNIPVRELVVGVDDAATKELPDHADE